MQQPAQPHKTCIDMMTCETTKKGFPALWESGGSNRNTGDAVIICNPDGTPKIPVYIRTNGHLANDNHALLVVEPGDVVVTSKHHKKDHTTQILLISEIRKVKGLHRAFFDLEAEFSNGEWSSDIFPGHFAAAVWAAQTKAETYHCREPAYIAESARLVANQ